MDDMYNSGNQDENNSADSSETNYSGNGGNESGNAEQSYQKPTVQEQLQQQYQQPTVQEQLQYQYQQPQDELEEPMTLGEWMITLLIMLIPCANIIMAFVWAFSSTEKKSKSNFFKAYLIFIAVVIVLCILASIVFGVFVASVASSYSYY